MRHKKIRIVLGAVMLVSGAVVLARGEPGRESGVLFLLVGAAFLFSAFKMNA